jgi:hypothetical protein
MRIENLRTEKKGDKTRVAATVTWEDSDRPVHELYYETDPAFSQDLTCNPNGFLVPCVMPAMYHEEKRVLMDAEVCPQLQEGLITAMGLMQNWWYPKKEKQIPSIEVKTCASPPHANSPRRAAMFFSGGIDSLSSLHKNRLNFPAEHPWSVKDGLLIFGLETDELEKFEHVKKSLKTLTEQAGLTLIPIYTNVRYLDDDWMFWQRMFQDSVYASVAHLFSKRLSVVSISSTYDIPHMQRDGSHPLLDINYSSSDLLLRHDAIQLSRLDKMKLVADWDLGFQNIRTCNNSHLYEKGHLNCGHCFKCVSAMLAFMALGVLDKTRSFPPERLTPQVCESAIEIYKSTLCFYEDLPPLLTERGHGDLARVVEKKISAYHDQQAKFALNQGIREFVKRLDRKLLNGALLKYKHRKEKS